MKILEVLKNELKTVDNLVDLNILWSRWQEKLKYMPQTYVMAEAVVS